ncbi:MAG: magnesium transporter [Spirochaetes bacterium]|nr:magnesium transporter [Spirochaetota bacterium]
MEAIISAVTEGRLIEIENLNKEEVLKLLTEKIKNLNIIPENYDIYNLIIEREKQLNTYLDFNIASPHCRIDFEGEIICSIGFSHNGIIFNEKGDKAKLIILFVIPKNKSNEYLITISKLIKFWTKYENLRDFENIYDLNAIQKRILEWIYIIENPEADKEDIEKISLHAETALITDMILPDIADLIKERKLNELKSFISELEPFQLADIMNNLPLDYSIIFFRILPKNKADEVFSLLEPENQNNLIKNLASEEIRELITKLPSDDRISLFEELPSQIVQKLIDLLDINERKKALEQLSYNEDSVGRLISNKYIAVNPEMKIKEVLEYIRRNGHNSETIETIYVINDKGKLIDDIDLKRIILANPEDKLESILDGSFVCLYADQKKEEAIQLFKKYDTYILPVVDSDGHLLGIVTHDDIIDVVEEVATEDFHKGSAILPLEKKFINTSIFDLWKRRISWLIILVFINIFSGAGLAHFETLIQTVVALVFFLPLLVDSGGNAGSQSSTLIIRSIALGEISEKDFIKITFKEFLVSLMLGIAMGIAVFILGWIRSGVIIGLAVSISMIAIIVISSLIGLLLPFLLYKFGQDPAVASGPLITSIADILGIILYMNLSSIILKAFHYLPK